jgi:hypothetical protein
MWCRSIAALCFFEACSAFTHVMACTLAESPCDPLHRKLRELRCLRCRFDCFYEKVIKVKADVAALLCLISVFVAFGMSGPRPLRLLVLLLFCVAFTRFPQKILPLGWLRSDDWQLSRPTAPLVLSVFP